MTHSQNKWKINFYKKTKTCQNELIPSQYLKKGDSDKVLARLQIGEIVIPKKHVKKITKYLKDEKIKLPNM